MDASTTCVPAVVDALIARARDGMSLQVIDGPRAAEDIEPDVFMVGLASDGGESVTVEVERAQGFGHRYAETFEIQCVISSFTGDTPMKDRRDACAAHLATLDALLKQDRALGGVADLVGLGPSMVWSQGQTPDGAVCEVAFSVVGKAVL